MAVYTMLTFPLPVITFSCDDVPHADVVVRGGGGELGSTPTPGQRTDGVDVGGDNLGDPPGQKVPDHDPPVIAAHSEQCSEPVEAAGDCHGDTVQRSIELLRIILTKRF